MKIGMKKYHEHIKVPLSQCHICKEEAKKIEEYYAQLRAEARKITGDDFKKIYFNSPREYKHIVLRPDFNSAGCLTHWHIELEESDSERNAKRMKEQATYKEYIEAKQ